MEDMPGGSKVRPQVTITAGPLTPRPFNPRPNPIPNFLSLSITLTKILNLA